MTHWWVFPLLFGVPLALSAIVTLRRRGLAAFYGKRIPRDSAEAPWGYRQPETFWPTSNDDAEYSVTAINNTDLDERPKY